MIFQCLRQDWRRPWLLGIMATPTSLVRQFDAMIVSFKIALEALIFVQCYRIKITPEVRPPRN